LFNFSDRRKKQLTSIGIPRRSPNIKAHDEQAADHNGADNVADQKIGRYSHAVISVEFRQGPAKQHKKVNYKKFEHALIIYVDQSTLFAMSQRGWHPFNGPARLKLQVIL
jgi:hypothetical protein